MGLAYRASQFFRAITAKPRTDELTQAEAYLPSGMKDLFRKLTPSDQSHGMAVLGNLLLSGEDNPDVLAAGLLHDLGKSCQRLHPWQRALVVLAKLLAPHPSSRWAVGEPRGWRRPFVVAARHPDWGAELIREAGGSELLVHLVRHHQDPPSTPPTNEIDRMLLALQTADGHN